MAQLPLESLISMAGLVLLVGALGGGGWLAVSELRVRALRRTARTRSSVAAIQAPPPNAPTTRIRPAT